MPAVCCVRAALKAGLPARAVDGGIVGEQKGQPEASLGA